jgi:hypothetical protein
MRWTRWLAYGAAAATSLATVVAFGAPAHAAYSEQPVSLPWHPSGPVHSSVNRSGVLYLGGELNGVGGIAAVDADTGHLLWQVPAGDDVRALALSRDGTRLYAGGSFTTVNGATHRHLVALNVAKHRVITSWKARTEGNVRDLLVRRNTVYIAGKIRTVNGVAQRGLWAVNGTTGVRDASFRYSADDDAFGLARAGKRLLVSGSFSRINGIARASLAAINLSTNTLTNWAPPRLCSDCDQYFDVRTDGTNAYVATSGNAAGAFDLTTGHQAWHRIRGDGDFQALSLPGDGRLYLGGHFGKEIWIDPNNRVGASNVAAVFTATGRIDTAWTPKIYKVYPGTWTITSTVGRLWVGGDFAGEQVNGVNNKEPYLAAYPVA